MKTNEAFFVNNQKAEITSLPFVFRIKFDIEKMLDSNMLKDEYKKNFKNVLMHSIRADVAMSDLSVTSKLSSDWEFLTMLRDRGRAYATDWLKHNFAHLNVRSSVDLEKEFL